MTLSSYIYILHEVMKNLEDSRKIVLNQMYIHTYIQTRIVFPQKEATFPLVRIDYSKKTIQGGLYINQGITF